LAERKYKGCGRRVVLPVRSRNARRLAARLEPETCNGVLVLIVCEGFNCRECVFDEKPEVIVRKVKMHDPLSGLYHELPVVEGVYRGRIIWRSVWKNGMLEVSGVECPSTPGP